MSSALFTAAIILGAVFIFIIGFTLLHKKGRDKKIAGQKTIFADIVWKNKLEISEKETINDYLLAIDKINFVLLYINFGQQKEEVTLIDLWNIKTAKVTTEDNCIYEQKKGKPVLVDKQVSQLQLEVTLAENKNVMLVLYEYKNGMQDFVHIKQRANYWSQTINNSVKELPHRSRQIVAQS
jgi:hypothetical protein